MSLLRIKELEAQLARRDERIADLERDAARYQWLRDEAKAGDWNKISGAYSGMLLIGDDLDAAIDAARMELT